MADCRSMTIPPVRPVTELRLGSLRPPCDEMVAKLVCQSCIQCGATCETHRKADRPRTAGMKSAFPIDPSREQEIEPYQSCVMGFDCETDRKTQNASQFKPLIEETPNGHHAK